MKEQRARKLIEEMNTPDETMAIALKLCPELASLGPMLERSRGYYYHELLSGFSQSSTAILDEHLLIPACDEAVAFVIDGERFEIPRPAPAGVVYKELRRHMRELGVSDELEFQFSDHSFVRVQMVNNCRVRYHYGPSIFMDETEN
jgi:hypothetical protein